MVDHDGLLHATSIARLLNHGSLVILVEDESCVIVFQLLLGRVKCKGVDTSKFRLQILQYI